MKETIFCGLIGLMLCLSCTAQQSEGEKDTNLTDSTTITIQTANEDCKVISSKGYADGLYWTQLTDDDATSHLKHEQRETIGNQIAIFLSNNKKWYKAGVRYAVYEANESVLPFNDSCIDNQSSLQTEGVDIKEKAKMGFDEGNDWAAITDKKRQGVRHDMIRSWLNNQPDTKYFKAGIDYAAYQNGIEFQW